MIINKFQFTPALAAQRRKVGIKDLRLYTQILLDVLSDQEPDPEMLHSLFFANDAEISE
jgi:hypothetical protein